MSTFRSMMRAAGLGGVGLTLLLLLSGCGDAPPPGQEALAEVETGTSRAEVLALLPDGDLSTADGEPDSRVAKGYRTQRYFTGGATVEVVWLHHSGTGGQAVDPRTELTPLLFRNDVLDGWGWDHFEERSGEWGLSGPPNSGAS